MLIPNLDVYGILQPQCYRLQLGVVKLIAAPPPAVALQIDKLPVNKFIYTHPPSSCWVVPEPGTAGFDAVQADLKTLEQPAD